MDMYIYLSTFRYLQEPHAWYILRCARVDFLWNDARNNRLLLGLIDQNRQKMMAVAPANLIRFQRATNMVGRLYLIRHFQVDWDPSDYLRFEGYAFVRSEWHIKINPNTQFIYLGPNIEANFPVYPWVSSIEALVRNERQRNLTSLEKSLVAGVMVVDFVCVK